MKWTVFSLAVAAVTLAAASASQAAPIAPSPPGVNQGNVIQVYLWHGHRYAHCAWGPHHTDYHCW